MPTISIRRSLLIALLGLSTVVSSAQSRFDKWKLPTCTTKKGPNGLQGIVDSSGQWVVQPYFDFLFFPYRCYLGEARYKGSNDYYNYRPKLQHCGKRPLSLCRYYALLHYHQ